MVNPQEGNRSYRSPKERMSDLAHIARETAIGVLGLPFSTTWLYFKSSAQISDFFTSTYLTATASITRDSEGTTVTIPTGLSASMIVDGKHVVVQDFSPGAVSQPHADIYYDDELITEMNRHGRFEIPDTDPLKISNTTQLISKIDAVVQHMNPDQPGPQHGNYRARRRHSR